MSKKCKDEAHAAWVAKGAKGMWHMPHLRLPAGSLVVGHPCRRPQPLSKKSIDQPSMGSAPTQHDANDHLRVSGNGHWRRAKPRKDVGHGRGV